MPQSAALSRTREVGFSQRPHKIPPEVSHVDRSDLNQLFASCIPRLRKKAARLLPIHEDREDALQDALLHGYRKLDQFTGRSQFSTWMYSILVNSALSLLRRQRARPKTSSLDGHGEREDEPRSELIIADPRSNPEEEFRREETFRLASKLLEALPPAYQPVFWLCDIKELGMKETAERLGRPIGTVKAQLHRAHRLIRKQARLRFPSQIGGRWRSLGKAEERCLMRPSCSAAPPRMGLKLRPSPIPKTLWDLSAYQTLRRGSRWREIRLDVLAGAGQHCSVCGLNGQGLSCHGIWSFDDRSATATLTGFGAYCPSCAAAINMGRPIRYERHDLGLSQLCRLNGMSLSEAKRLTADAMRTWKKRNKRSWRIAVAPCLLERYPHLRVMKSEEAKKDDRSRMRFSRVSSSVLGPPASQAAGNESQKAPSLSMRIEY
jgi:RNA polymerase sigma factor (sigma-70 family)